jgi:hypothetical protein
MAKKNWRKGRGESQKYAHQPPYLMMSMKMCMPITKKMQKKKLDHA